MSSTQQKSLRKVAEAYGVGLHCWSPGDGDTRYQFETRDGGRNLSPVLVGPRQAVIWIDGYREGRRDAHASTDRVPA